MKLTIDVGKYAHCLWDSEHKSFMHEPSHEGSFDFLEGNSRLRKGQIFFCESYLNAKMTEAYLKKKFKVKTALYGARNTGPSKYVILASLKGFT